MADSTPKKGRPRGAKNIERPVIVDVPPACPVDRNGCGSTDFEVLRIIGIQEFSGTLPGGHLYTHIVSRRVRCTACGQHFVVRSYERRAKEYNGIPVISSEPPLQGAANEV
jgi:hypothetical protein